MVEQLIGMTSTHPVVVIVVLLAIVLVHAATFALTGSMLVSSLAGLFAVSGGVAIGWLPSWILEVCLFLFLLVAVSKVLTLRFEEGGSNEERVVKFSLFGIPLIKK